jgi:predicted DNA-binding protein
MARSKAKPKKRGRGRPATGRDPMIGLRLPKDEIARLDKWAKANGYTRSELIRVLIERGFEGWLLDNALNEATDGVMRQARRIAELEHLVAELKAAGQPSRRCALVMRRSSKNRPAPARPLARRAGQFLPRNHPKNDPHSPAQIC